MKCNKNLESHEKAKIVIRNYDYKHLIISQGLLITSQGFLTTSQGLLITSQGLLITAQGLLMPRRPQTVIPQPTQRQHTKNQRYVCMRGVCTHVCLHANTHTFIRTLGIYIPYIYTHIYIVEERNNYRTGGGRADPLHVIAAHWPIKWIHAARQTYM